MKPHSVKSGGLRIDLYLFDLFPDLTRSKIQSLIKSHKILLDNEPTKSSYILKGDEEIQYDLKFEEDKKDKSIEAEEMSINIIHEDSAIIVINKNPGVVVHPGAGNYTGTILNGLIDKIDKTSFNSTPGIVHRLDKETSGVMIIAKNFKAHAFLSKQFEKREVSKIYRALVWGSCDDNGVIEGYIVRNEKNRKSFILSKSDRGRHSKTKYKLIEKLGPISYLELKPHTGRTHQIRVHMKSIGHPILSDDTYSGGSKMIKSFHVKYTKLLKNVLKCMDRVALHAETIEFIHPLTNKKVMFKADCPDDFNEALKIIRNNETI
jgi:23S rRNA pseudouridine1911/1915/1917 synthase